MFNKKISLISNKPFKYFVIDSLLDKEVYIDLKKNLMSELKNIVLDRQDNLYETFGGGDLKKSENENRASKFNNSLNLVKSTFAKNKTIIDFIELICSQKFADYLYENKITDRKYEIVEPFHKLSLFEYLFKQKTYISLKFSQYGTGSFINLHRDNGQKKYAFFFYFGFTDNIERKSGGTQICKPNIKIEDHQNIDENNYDIAYDIFPLDNRFAGFQVSNNSWHCVNPIDYLPDGVKRLNLQINYMRCNYYTYPLKIYKKIISLIS